MRYEERWETVKPLGEGGQGKVFLARDRHDFNTDVIRGQVIGAVSAL